MVFRDDEDRLAFLRLFADTLERYRWRCYVFCLMGTHYHLVVAARQPDLSAGVQWLDGVYARRFNIRHDRTGHLFGARFVSWLIDTDEHLQHACEYVLQNPVRAGLCRRAEDWQWSGSNPRRTYVR